MKKKGRTAATAKKGGKKALRPRGPDGRFLKKQEIVSPPPARPSTPPVQGAEPFAAALSPVASPPPAIKDEPLSPLGVPPSIIIDDELPSSATVVLGTQPAPSATVIMTERVSSPSLEDGGVKRKRDGGEREGEGEGEGDEQASKRSRPSPEETGIVVSTTNILLQQLKLTDSKVQKRKRTARVLEEEVEEKDDRAPKRSKPSPKETKKSEAPLPRVSTALSQ